MVKHDQERVFLKAFKWMHGRLRSHKKILYRRIAAGLGNSLEKEQVGDFAEDERKAVSLKESFDRLVVVVVCRNYTFDQGHQQA